MKYPLENIPTNDEQSTTLALSYYRQSPLLQSEILHSTRYPATISSRTSSIPPSLYCNKQYLATVLVLSYFIHSTWPLLFPS